MRRGLWLALLALAGCGGVEADERLVTPVYVQQGFVASDIKTFEVYVVTAASLGADLDQACAKFFDDTLGEIAPAQFARFAFDAAVPETRSRILDAVPKDERYTVFVQGWNVDREAQPDAPDRRVVALGCAPNVPVLPGKRTSVTMRICLLQEDGSEPVCPE